MPAASANHALTGPPQVIDQCDAKAYNEYSQVCKGWMVHRECSDSPTDEAKNAGEKVKGSIFLTLIYFGH